MNIFAIISTSMTQRIKTFVGALTFTLSLATPFVAMASTQIFMARTDVAINATLGGPAIWVDEITAADSATVVSAAGAFPVPGAFRNMNVIVDTAPGGAASWVITLRRNGVDTALTCTISGSATSCSDKTHVAPVEVGDILSYREVASNSPAGAVFYFSTAFSPTTANETVIMAGSVTNLSTSALFYSEIGGTGSRNGTETLTQRILPEAGTLDNLFIGTNNTAPGSGTSYVFTTRQNAATSTQTCTIADTNKTCTDTTNPITVAANDLFVLADQPLNTPAALRIGFGYRFVPVTKGDFIFMGGAGTTVMSQTNNSYFPLSGSESTIIAASSTNYVQHPMLIKGISATIQNAAGVGKSRTFSLVVNNATTTLSCTISGSSARTCSSLGAITLNPGDTLYTSADFAGGAPNVSRAGVSYIAQVRDTSNVNIISQVMRLFRGSRMVIQQRQ